MMMSADYSWKKSDAYEWMYYETLDAISFPFWEISKNPALQKRAHSLFKENEIIFYLKCSA